MRPSVVRKTVNVFTNGILPVVARPAAVATMSDSAMPMLKWRSGCALAKMPLFVEPDRSASSTTMFSLVSPSSASTVP